ncbi:MAG: hypothetical protein EPO24_04675, partial [Bacteroidetes bacterium]
MNDKKVTRFCKNLIINQILVLIRNRPLSLWDRGKDEGGQECSYAGIFKTIFLFSLLLITSSLSALEQPRRLQSLDELENAITELHSVSNLQSINSNEQGPKCGLWFTMEAARLLSQASNEEKDRIRKLL